MKHALLSASTGILLLVLHHDMASGAGPNNPCREVNTFTIECNLHQDCELEPVLLKVTGIPFKPGCPGSNAKGVMTIDLKTYLPPETFTLVEDHINVMLFDGQLVQTRTVDSLGKFMVKIRSGGTYSNIFEIDISNYRKWVEGQLKAKLDAEIEKVLASKNNSLRCEHFLEEHIWVLEKGRDLKSLKMLMDCVIVDLLTNAKSKLEAGAVARAKDLFDVARKIWPDHPEIQRVQAELINHLTETGTALSSQKKYHQAFMHAVWCAELSPMSNPCKKVLMQSKEPALTELRREADQLIRAKRTYDAFVSAKSCLELQSGDKECTKIFEYARKALQERRKEILEAYGTKKGPCKRQCDSKPSSGPVDIVCRDFCTDEDVFLRVLSAGDIEEIQALLATGSKVNVYLEGMTPLHFAILKQQWDVVPLLIDAGASVRAKAIGYADATPLDFAVQTKHCGGGCISAVIRLLREGAQVNGDPGTDQTPLHRALSTAAESYNLILVSLLLAAGADPNARTAHGLTPLHYATCNMAGDDIVKLLLLSGADPEARTEKGFGTLEDQGIAIHVGTPYGFHGTAATGFTPMDCTMGRITGISAGPTEQLLKQFIAQKTATSSSGEAGFFSKDVFTRLVDVLAIWPASQKPGIISPQLEEKKQRVLRLEDLGKNQERMSPGEQSAIVYAMAVGNHDLATAFSNTIDTDDLEDQSAAGQVVMTRLQGDTYMKKAYVLFKKFLSMNKSGANSSSINHAATLVKALQTQGYDERLSNVEKEEIGMKVDKCKLWQEISGNIMGKYLEAMRILGANFQKCGKAFTDLKTFMENQKADLSNLRSAQQKYWNEIGEYDRESCQSSFLPPQEKVDWQKSKDQYSKLVDRFCKKNSKPIKSMLNTMNP